MKNGDFSSKMPGLNIKAGENVLFSGEKNLSWDKDLGAWDLDGVKKLEITFNGEYSGWLGLLFQNKAGNNLWKGQKDYGPADGEYTIELTGNDLPTGTDWYICGGTSGSCKITKVTAYF